MTSRDPSSAVEDPAHTLPCELMPPELSQWIPAAVIIGIMLYLHRITRQDMKDLRGEVTDLRGRMGRLEERMARLEGTLDVLREFFVRNGRGTAA